MKRSGLILLVLVLPFLSGCFSVSNYFREVRSDIIENVEGDFILDTEFSIGPSLISLAGMFVDSEEDPEAKQILKDISSVEVGVYKRRFNGEESNYKLLRRIDNRMQKHGWRYIVKSCSKDEVSAIYINRKLDKGIRRMFIVSMDRNELALIQLKGDLSKAFEVAVHERGLNSYSMK
jgi:hypothetical protein